MPTPVLMPQMGESIAEGTIVRWIKKVGDAVDRDEPLFEISTDKVDAEVPSPTAGVLSEIRAKEGDTVPVHSVVATIGEAGSAAAEAVPEPAPQPDGTPSPRSAPAATAPPASGAATSGPVSAPAPGIEAAPANGHATKTADELRRAKSSPLVRKIAKEHNVDIGGLHGSGIGGRVTKHDILEYLDSRPADISGGHAPGGHVPAFRPGEAVEVVPMPVMRKKIAEHMVLSRHTSAHVHSVFEVNYSRVSALRDQKKAEYEQKGAKLTYMAFIAKAVVDALRATPIVNASIDGDNIVYKKDINLGIAVALDWGLIVPVLKNADEKNLLGLSRGIADLAARARAKQLKPEDVQGGTFTITNPGTFGAQFGLPIINQPQVAILGVGSIEKRAVVIDDAIAIRPMGYLALGFDHRLIDGAAADQFMARIKSTLEHFEDCDV
jgi:2-oxoglutarate dehydrogenase E2 component (dihydrolipoamide succinyltransferase)